MNSTFGIRMVLIGMLVLLAGSYSVGFAASSGGALEAMKETIDKVLVVLQKEELKSEDKKEERLSRLIEVIGQRFDYEEMGKRTLSREWEKS